MVPFSPPLLPVTLHVFDYPSSSNPPGSDSFFFETCQHLYGGKISQKSINLNNFHRSGRWRLVGAVQGLNSGSSTQRSSEALQRVLGHFVWLLLVLRFQTELVMNTCGRFRDAGDDAANTHTAIPPSTKAL